MNIEFHKTMTVTKENELFSGHFPGQPIFPGVGIVDVSLESIRIHLESPSADIREIRSSKFMGFIEPDDEVQIQGSSEDGREWFVEWTKHSKAVARIHFLIDP